MRRFNCVLLIDDDEFNNYLNQKILNHLGIAKEIKIVKNGKEALDFIDNFSEDHGNAAPEIILLDIKMPVMDGFEFLSQWQKLQFANEENVEIIVLTTSSNQKDMERLHYFNIKHHILKPLSEEKLIDFFVYNYPSV